MIPTLTNTDLEQPRTQAELRKWVDDLHRRFGQTNEGKRAVRLNRGKHVKKFKEEIWPLALFADAFYRGRSEVLFKPFIGSQPSYDAQIIEVSTGHPLHYLEITQAFDSYDERVIEASTGQPLQNQEIKQKFDGYQNHLRMVHLVEHGRAPVTGPKLEQDKASGCVRETWPEVERHDHLLARTFAAIQEAVCRKSLKPYGSHTSLIVEFEDHYIHSESDRRTLNDFARSIRLPTAAPFAALYLVSDRERLAFKYEIHAAGCARLDEGG